jgi:hypothetical protein
VKKISNKDWKRVSDLIAALTKSKEDIESAFAQHVAPLFEQVNEQRTELQSVLDDLANAAEEHYEGRSDKWKEGDAGQAYESWKDELSSIRDDADTEIETPEMFDDGSELDSLITKLNEELKQDPED